MSDAAESHEGERIAKVIARAGVCSRREAEKLIDQGRVTVNGETLDAPGVKVTDSDEIRIDGEVLPAREPPRLWRYHKPLGLVTSHKDERGRTTVFDSLPEHLPRVISIGRLDLNSEGLLLLTNDGGLARELEHPSRGWTRRYRVRVHGTVTEAMFAPLAKGVTVDGVNYGPVDVSVDRKPGANVWLTVRIKEGKNREIRRVMEHVGLKVNRLIRTAYGPFQLGNLKPGDLQEVPGKVLREQLGTSLNASDPGTGKQHPAAGAAKAQPGPGKKPPAARKRSATRAPQADAKGRKASPEGRKASPTPRTKMTLRSAKPGGGKSRAGKAKT